MKYLSKAIIKILKENKMKTKLNYKIIQETANEDYHAFFNGRKWGFIDSN